MRRLFLTALVVFVFMPAAALARASVTAPDTSIVSKPPSPTKSTSATFGFVSNTAGATFECKLDAAAYAACTSPKTYTGLLAGRHTFSVRARAGGIADSTPATYSWVIDITPPNTLIGSAPVYPTSWTNAAFVFSSTEAGSSFACKLDAGAWARCANAIEYFGLAVGSHSFAVKATDKAGNTDATPAIYAWPISPPPTGLSAGLVRSYALQHMASGASPTEAQAIVDAEHFDVITAQWMTYPSFLSQMKAANPAVTLYVYMNATFTYRTNLPESAYCHDQYGSRIEPLPFPATYMLNPASPDAIAFQQNRAVWLFFNSGYQGLFLDVVGTAPLYLSYVEALCINPATGQAWTASDWLAAVRHLIDEIKVTIVSRPILINSLKDGIRYWDPAAPTSASLTPAIAGAIAETSLREARSPITSYPSETAWKQHVDMLVDAGRRGYSVFQLTKTWTTGTQAQKAAWHKFALASYLMGNDGRARFAFSYTEGDATVDRPLNHLDLGAAKGAYAKMSGVYQRSFQRGRVLLNAGTTTVTIPLGATYHRLTGAAVTSVTLPPKSAEILRL